MKHLELLNPSEVLDTYNNVCPNNDVIDLCHICDVDCGCDTYVCVDVCGVCDNNYCDCNINTCGVEIC